MGWALDRKRKIIQNAVSTRCYAPKGKYAGLFRSAIAAPIQARPRGWPKINVYER